MAKKNKYIVFLLFLICFIMSSCKSESNNSKNEEVSNAIEISDEESMDETEVDCTNYDKVIYEGEYVTIVCNSIYNDRIEFSATSKLKNNCISVVTQSVALDGLVPEEYYGGNDYRMDIEPGQTVQLNYYAYINYTEHKTMAACFEVFNDEGRGIESVDIIDFDLGLTENIEYEEPESILVFDNQTLGIAYVGADDVGIRLRVNNKRPEAVTIGFDRPFLINEKEYNEVVTVMTLPSHSITDYYFYVKNYDPDYVPEDIESFKCTGYTYRGSQLDIFSISSDKEVAKVQSEQENTSITKNTDDSSEVELAYMEATNLRIDSLEKNSKGTYSYNGLTLLSDDTDWLDTEWGKDAEYLNSGALYRSYAKKLEGFYVLGESMYGMWKGNVKNIFGFDAPETWEEMKPYVDKVFPYIRTNDYFISMMDKFSKLESFEGTIDTINGIYDFRIKDVEKATSELGITQEMFGYMIAALEEYAPNVNFEGKVYQFSLDLDIPVKDISYDDYTAYINETESYENSMYKRLKDEYSNEGGVDYFFYIEGVDPYKEGVITTARGIQIGSSKNLVISLYGEPEKEISNKKDNDFKTGLKNSQTEEYYNYYIESCDSLLVYNYEDKGHIIFWIDKNDEVSGVAYTDSIFL